MFCLLLVYMSPSTLLYTYSWYKVKLTAAGCAVCRAVFFVYFVIALVLFNSDAAVVFLQITVPGKHISWSLLVVFRDICIIVVRIIIVFPNRNTTAWVFTLLCNKTVRVTFFYKDQLIYCTKIMQVMHYAYFYVYKLLIILH